jgi:hypothetical protein
MNILGFLFLVWVTFITHIVLRRYNELETEQRKMLETYKNTYAPAGYNNQEKRIQDIVAANVDNNYHKVDRLNYEDYDGFMDNDDSYKMLKEDLLKYVEEQGDKNNITEIQKEPVYSEKVNASLNENVLQLKKKDEKIEGKVPEMSMDKAFGDLTMKNQKNIGGVKSLTPDLWTYENESVLNGAKFGEIDTFDPMMSSYSML